MKKIKFFTIGVYDSTEDEFFRKLTENKIDTFVDIRQRRGVRGAKYSFVNSKKLQEKLSTLNINYIYAEQLAPTDELRRLQKDDIKSKGITRQDGHPLSGKFISSFKSGILARFNFNQFFRQLEEMKAENVALFCVESSPASCHRSITSSHIKSEFGNPVKDL